MKIFILKCCKFIVFFIPFYIFFIISAGTILPPFMKNNIIYTRNGSGFTYQRIQELQEYKNVDVLFLGSSRAYRSFDTRIYSKKSFSSFNLGTSNQTPSQSRYLLMKYYSQLKPKTIIMEVNPDMMSNDGTESTLDIISSENIDWPLLKMVLNHKNIKTINTFIFASFTNIFFSKNYTFDRYTNQDDLYISGGFVQNLDTTFYFEKGKNYFCNLSNAQLKALDDIYSFSIKNGTKIIFVQSPVTKNIYASCSINKSFDEIISKKYEYYNFNEIENFIDTIHFSDLQHLNQKGADLFNYSILKNIMQQN